MIGWSERERDSGVWGSVVLGNANVAILFKIHYLLSLAKITFLEVKNIFLVFIVYTKF